MSHDEIICPVCGASVPAKARACPECGADEKTGWSRDTIYDATDIDDPEEFDYEDWKRREVEGLAPRRTKRQWFWWGMAIVVLAVLLWLFVVRQWCAIP